jgi:hypothetical protein
MLFGGTISEANEVMAGDWIKMRKELLTSPKVVRIMSACHADRLRTIGGLFAVWSLFDEQTTDGKLDAYTPKILDEFIGFQGLAEGMLAVGWLEVDEKGRLIAANFEEHNGKTAKRRALENVRKMSARTSASHADKLRPKRREEKIRDKNKTPLPPLDVPAELQDICQDWLNYKKEKRKTYTPTGLREFFAEVRQVAASAGVEEVKRRFQRAMASNYQGWNFESQGGSGKPASKPVTFGQQRQQNTLDLLERLKAQDEAAAAGVAGFIGEASK